MATPSHIAEQLHTYSISSEHLITAMLTTALQRVKTEGSSLPVSGGKGGEQLTSVRRKGGEQLTSVRREGLTSVRREGGEQLTSVRRKGGEQLTSVRR